LDRGLKRQIKQDDLVTGVETSWAWLKRHQEQAKLWGLVTLVVVVGAGAFQWFRAERQAEGQHALGEALAILAAPVRAEEPGAPEPAAGSPSFQTQREKLTKALPLLDGVQQRYASMPAGRTAAYQAALCRLELGEFDKARPVLTDLAAQNSDTLLAAQAKLSLAELEARAGQVDKAVAGLQQLANDQTSALPRDYALMRLAATFEDARRIDEAARVYRRVSQDFPESVFAAEAQRKADYLGAS
jgi:TolA-binding protein